MKNKYTVTVALPVLNEEKNIAKVLKEILVQKQDNYKLEKILVLSDGSTDKTETIVNNIRSSKIQLLSYKSRKGKPARINDSFKYSVSDITIIFDADIQLSNDRVISELVEKFDDSRIVLVSGSAEPISSDNFISRVVLEGIKIWNRARKSTPNAEMYFCEGAVRAFRKSLYKKIKFPNKSADDNYPFLYLNDPLKFGYAVKAKIYFKIPSTLKEAISQQIRYKSSPLVHESNFGRDIVNKYYVIGSREKAKAMLSNFLVNPGWTLLYLIFTSYIKLLLITNRSGNDAKWQITLSTK